MVCSRGWADSRPLELDAFAKDLSGKGGLLVAHIVVENAANAVRAKGHAKYPSFANLGAKLRGRPLGVNHHEVRLCLSIKTGCARKLRCKLDRPLVVFTKPRANGLQSDQARRRQKPRLPHPPAEALAPSAGLLDESQGAAKDRTHGSSKGLAKAEIDRIK